MKSKLVFMFIVFNILTNVSCKKSDETNADSILGSWKVTVWEWTAHEADDWDFMGTFAFTGSTASGTVSFTCHHKEDMVIYSGVFSTGGGSINFQVENTTESSTMYFTGSFVNDTKIKGTGAWDYQHHRTWNWEATKN